MEEKPDGISETAIIKVAGNAAKKSRENYGAEFWPVKMISYKKYRDNSRFLLEFWFVTRH